MKIHLESDTTLAEAQVNAHTVVIQAVQKVTLIASAKCYSLILFKMTCSLFLGKNVHKVHLKGLCEVFTASVSQDVHTIDNANADDYDLVL